MFHNGTANEISNDIILHPQTYLIIITLTVSLCMICFNIPVFFVVPKIHSLGNTAKFMLSLACTDVGFGISRITMIIINLSRNNFYMEIDSLQCIYDGSTAPFFCAASVHIMTIMNLDKMFSICFPFRYRQIVSQSKIVLNLLVSSPWLINVSLFLAPGLLRAVKVKYEPAALMCMVDFSGNLPYLIIAGLGFALFFPAIGLAISAVGIFRVARKQKHQIEAVQVSNAIKLTKSDFKIIRTLVIMVASFFVMFLPYFIFVNIWEYCIAGHTFHPATDFLGYWLGISNSIVNPLIYIPTLRAYRYKLVELLHLTKWTHIQEPDQISSVSQTA